MPDDATPDVDQDSGKFRGQEGTYRFPRAGAHGRSDGREPVKAGYDVAGFDVVPAAVEAAREHGVPVAASAAEAVAGADVVLTMFPSGQHVLDAYLGTGGQPGLLATSGADTMFLDCSTINVDEAREAAARLALAAGHRSVDAPVSGGVVGAEAGTLTFMVGAQEDLRRRAAPAGRDGQTGSPLRRARRGPSGQDLQQPLLGVSMIAVSEAFILGEKLGLTHQALFDVASAASGQCWALTTNCPVPGRCPPVPANRDYQPGFAGALMAKDLKLALNAVQATGVAARMGPLASEIYDRFAAEGGAGRDFSGIITDIRDKSGK